MSKEERALDLPGKPPRFIELDSLRGLAALSVVYVHFSLAYMYGRPFAFLRTFPLRILLNGGSAVTLFFLLSGFVLSLPYRHRGVEYVPFLVRRIAASICLTLAPFCLQCWGTGGITAPFREQAWTGMSVG